MPVSKMKSKILCILGVQWGDVPATTIRYTLAFKIPLHVRPFHESCFNALTTEALREFVEIAIPCLREEGVEVPASAYLASLYRYFLFLQLQLDKMEIHVDGAYDDGLSAKERKRMLRSILALVAVPILRRVSGEWRLPYIGLFSPDTLAAILSR